MRLFMVCLCLFGIAIAAGADQVSPSDRVSNCGNVRQSADVNGPGAGIPRPNQTATLIESIFYWHPVRAVGAPKTLEGPRPSRRSGSKFTMAMETVANVRKHSYMR